MSVHYKFKSALEFDTVTFDGLHISVNELKKAILYQKRIGKNTDFDLQIINAQTKEVYTDDNTLIPKNTSLIVARIPLTIQQRKIWEKSESNQQLLGIVKVDSLNGVEPGVNRLAKAADLSSLDVSEEEKIQAMMTQSTQDYNPSNYMKIRGASQVGEVPSNYRCYRCHQPGHWIKNCPLGPLGPLGQDTSIEIKKSTGIPRSFMVPVEGPTVPGAMMTPSGLFAVPAIDHQAYKEGKKEKPPFQHEPEPTVEKPEIPEELVCTICKDLLTDAVMIPCCGNSFCDDCIRMVLLESEDHECPDCREKDVSPDTLIPNRFLRKAVNNFKNETGYHKPRRLSTLKAVPLVPEVVQQITPVPPSATEKEVCSLNEAASASHSVSVPTTNVIEVVGVPKSVSAVPVVTSQSSAAVTHFASSVSAPQIPGVVAPVRDLQSLSLSDAKSYGLANTLSSAVPPLGLPEATNVTVAAVHGGGPSQAASLSAPGSDLPKQSVPSVTSHIMKPTTVMASNTVLSASNRAPAIETPVPQQVFVPKTEDAVEDRPGTPTVDECNVDAPGITSATLPDTSVPPPNFAPGDNFQQIKIIPTVRDHRLPYRTDQSYIHRVGLQILPPQPAVPLAAVQPPAIPILGATVVTSQHPLPTGSYVPHTQYEQIQHSGYGVESGVRSYAEGRIYRGYRGRGRGSHGYRGHHHHHQQPLPPGVVRNENQPGVIDDPLEEFERMLRENQNRKKQRKHITRSPRSSSRTRSRSRDISHSPRSFSPHSRTPSPLPRSRSVSRGRVIRSRSPRSRSPPRSRLPARTPPRARSLPRTPPRARSPPRTPPRTPPRALPRTPPRSPPRISPRASPRSPPRKRSRTRSRTRSRSRSFTISRSRSNSFSRSLTPSPRNRSPLPREFSPRRHERTRYRSPLRTPPPRFQRPFKDRNVEYDAASSYYELDYPQYSNTGVESYNEKGRGRYRKDYSKDYYNQNYNRYGRNRYGTGSKNEDLHHQQAQIANHSSLPSRYDSQPSYRQYEIQPPGTGVDLPDTRLYEKVRYDHGYERTSRRRSRSPVDEYLTPPGVDVRHSDYSLRERDNVLPSRDSEMTISSSRDRTIRDVGSRDKDSQQQWETKERKPRDQGSGKDFDHNVPRDRERDIRVVDRSKDWGGEFYESDYRHGYESRSFGYGSSDNRRRKHSLSPVRSGNNVDKFTTNDKSRHTRSDRNDNHRKVDHVSHNYDHQPVEAIDVRRDRNAEERISVLVEVRKEPSVDRTKKEKEEKPKREREEKSKKDDDDKSKDKKCKERKKRKKDKDLETDKVKKKKKEKKEKRDGKKDVENKEPMVAVIAETEKARSEKGEMYKTSNKPLAIKNEHTDESLTTKNLSTEDKTLNTGVGDNEKMKPSDDSSNTLDLYGGIPDVKIDTSIVSQAVHSSVTSDTVHKKEMIAESQSHEKEKPIKDNAENNDKYPEESKLEIVKTNDVLAPLPELSKWELDDEVADDKNVEENAIISEDSDKLVTSEVLKRAENAIFQKAINAIRPFEVPKKSSSSIERKASIEKKTIDLTKDDSDVNKKPSEKETRKTANSIQVTIPIIEQTERSVELASDSNETKAKRLDRMKFTLPSTSTKETITVPHRVSAKERLGAKLEADDDKKDDKGRRHGYNRRSRSPDRKRIVRKGLKSAVECKRTNSRSRSRSPYHRKVINRKDPKYIDYMKSAKYLEALEMRRYMENERRYVDPVLERKYIEQVAKRDYVEPDRFGEASLVRDRRRVENRGYSPERQRVQSEMYDRNWPKQDERERSLERHKTKHKKRSKTRETRKKSVSDRESKRGKKKDKKHKKEKLKKTKGRIEKDEKSSDNINKDKVKITEANSELKDKLPKSESVQVQKELVQVQKESVQVQKDTVQIQKDSEQSTTKQEESEKDVVETEKKMDRKNPKFATDRKKSTLDEASFEPDYDASSSLDSDTEDVGEKGKKIEYGDKAIEKSKEAQDSPTKKRGRSKSGEDQIAVQKIEKKRQKVDKTVDVETRKSKISTGKAKKQQKSSSSEADTSDDESSDEESSSSSSSYTEESSEDSISRKRRKKKALKKHRKKKVKRSRHVETSSESESESDSDDPSSSDSDSVRSRKKKHKHHSKTKQNKKRKKSKRR